MCLIGGFVRHLGNNETGGKMTGKPPQQVMIA